MYCSLMPPLVSDTEELKASSASSKGIADKYQHRCHSHTERAESSNDDNPEGCTDKCNKLPLGRKKLLLDGNYLDTVW